LFHGERCDREIGEASKKAIVREKETQKSLGEDWKTR